MKTFSTREEVLQDTINYYWGKPERKCVELGVCKYPPVGESEGCAVGRLVPREIADKLDERGSSISDEVQFNLLPEWMKEMGHQFWYKLQRMHDDGLLAKQDSAEVEKIVSNLCVDTNICIDMSKITFPENVY
jgi:hypothetical protein